MLQAQGAGGPRMPRPEVLSTRASGRPSSGWRDLWLQRPCSHRPPSLSGWVRGVCKPPVAWPQLTPVSSVFSATLFPSSPHRIAPSGRKVPKLMFSRKVRAAVRPGEPPRRAGEGPGPGAEQGASSRAARAQPPPQAAPPTLPASLPLLPPSHGPAHPEGQAARFCLPGPTWPGLPWLTALAGLSSGPGGPEPSPPCPLLGCCSGWDAGHACLPARGSTPALYAKLGI